MNGSSTLYSLPNSLSSLSNGADEVFCFYAPRMELNARIFKARKDAGMTQDQLASATGKTRPAVAQWESGLVRPRHSTLQLIAKATGKSLAWLENAVEEEFVGLFVVGEVAAGLWKEATVAYQQQGVPVAPDPRFPASAQRLYKVVGTSVNRYVPDGEYVHCVDVAEAGIKVRNGDLVIARREKHDLTEYTAKEYWEMDGRAVLRPASTDPDWQFDIPLDLDDGTELTITDIVIAKWSPLFRR